MMHKVHYIRSNNYRYKIHFKFLQKNEYNITKWITIITKQMIHQQNRNWNIICLLMSWKKLHNNGHQIKTKKTALSNKEVILNKLLSKKIKLVHISSSQRACASNTNPLPNKIFVKHMWVAVLKHPNYTQTIGQLC